MHDCEMHPNVGDVKMWKMCILQLKKYGIPPTTVLWYSSIGKDETTKLESIGQASEGEKGQEQSIPGCENSLLESTECSRIWVLNLSLSV